MDTEATEITALISHLDHSDKPKIRAAVDKLIELGADSEQIRQLLDERLVQPGHKNYWPVAYILGHLAQPSATTLRILIEALDHREPDIRWANALLLERIAKNERSVLALFIGLCETGTANQKRMAIYCLRDLALTDSQSLVAIVNSLSDLEPTVRVAAATSLKTRKDINDTVRRMLLQVYLNDADERVRSAVAVTLASFGSPAEQFVQALSTASKSGNAQAKKAAEAALKLLQK
jgi:HEAT repeat protein